jgi:hypothetical protein
MYSSGCIDSNYDFDSTTIKHFTSEFYDQFGETEDSKKIIIKYINLLNANLHKYLKDLDPNNSILSKKLDKPNTKLNLINTSLEVFPIELSKEQKI